MATFIKLIGDNSALVISILALLFTIGSFWWMNWRRGKLIVSKPGTFGASAKRGNDVFVELPLVFYNDGPRAHIVRDLRLVLTNGEKTEILPFTFTVSKLRLNDDKSYAAQFPVEGRQTYSSVFGFIKRPSFFSFIPPKCNVLLVAKLYPKDSWKKLLEFDLIIPEDKVDRMNSDTFLIYSNDPEYLYEKD